MFYGLSCITATIQFYFLYFFVILLPLTWQSPTRTITYRFQNIPARGSTPLRLMRLSLVRPIRARQLAARESVDV